MVQNIASQPVRGDIIEKALEKLDFMGLNMKETLTTYFQSHGVNLDAKHFYTLAEIEKEVQRLFGESATEIIIQQIESGIKALF